MPDDRTQSFSTNEVKPCGINLDLQHELVDTQASYEELTSFHTVPEYQHEAEIQGAPSIRVLVQTRSEEEIPEPSYAQRLRATRNGYGYSQSHRLLPASFPLYMSVVTEGTPEDEQSSRNQTSMLKNSLDQ